MRPGAQLEASQHQHSELCKQLQGAEITLDAIFLRVPPSGQGLLVCTHGWLTIHLGPFVLMRGGAWQRQRASRYYKYVQQVAATLTTMATDLTSTIRARANETSNVQQFIFRSQNQTYDRSTSNVGLGDHMFILGTSCPHTWKQIFKRDADL
eukprot:22319-Pelagomonas_calceolata.AAC.1